MVKKLSGKAIYEPKGAEKRKRDKAINEAFEFWKSITPFVIAFFIILMIYFTFYIQKRGEALKQN